MSQHFLISPAARTLSLRDIMRMSDDAAHARFVAIRFAVNNGEPFCPHCGILKVYTLAETPIRWKCSGCRRKFSVTSGTLFHSRKLPIREYLSVIALFCNGVKGVAALRMARDMNINPKSAFVLLHKLREAIGAVVIDGAELAGEVEIDGAYFGSRIRPANRLADRRQQRREDSNRQVVVVARERGLGRTVPWVVSRESDAVPMIDAVLRMFRPDFKAEGLPIRHRRPTKSPYFAHGELTKRIYDAMRISGSVSSFEIAAAAMRDKGLNPENDKPTRTDFVRRVSLALGDMQRKGKVEKIGRGRAMRWKLADA